MRTVSSELQSHYEGEVLTLADCWLVRRRDGTELGFTSHVEKLVINGTTYKAESGVFRTAIDQSAGLSTDNLDVLGLLHDDGITEDDIRAGKYRDAEAWYFQVNYEDLSQGKLKLDYGYIGEITRRRGVYVAEFRSLMQRLDQQIGERYGRDCPYKLGDSNCGVVLEPDTWAASTAYSVGDTVKSSSYDARRYVCTTAGNSGASEPTWDTTIGNTTSDGSAVWTAYEAWTKEGTVTVPGSDRRSFVDSGRTEDDDWFTFGELTWTSGDNNGVSMDVKRSLSDGSVVLKFKLPFQIKSGDTYKISAGCNRLLRMPSDTWGSNYTGDCRAKFDNAVNFGGFPDLPSNDQLFAGPQ